MNLLSGQIRKFQSELIFLKRLESDPDKRYVEESGLNTRNRVHITLKNPFDDLNTKSVTNILGLPQFSLPDLNMTQIGRLDYPHAIHFIKVDFSNCVKHSFGIIHFFSAIPFYFNLSAGGCTADMWIGICMW